LFFVRVHHETTQVTRATVPMTSAMFIRVSGADKAKNLLAVDK
jgi:hypothetical protein